MRSVVKEVLHAEGFSTDELAVYFVSQKEIARLHEQFFNDPSPTDCITLPIDGCKKTEVGYHLLGEVFICPKAALDYGSEEPYLETTLYLVHALLHLLGYDDKEAKKRAKMRAAEKRLLELLQSKDLLLKPALGK